MLEAYRDALDKQRERNFPLLCQLSLRVLTQMTTIPSRLATLTRSSPSAVEARKRALSLYRDWYRSVGLVLYSQETSQISRTI